MKKFMTLFIRCGIFGWCLEILFTSMQSLRRREMTGMGTTSLFMFFIYGMGAFLLPVHALCKRFSAPLRGMIYTLCIFFTEYVTGSLLRQKHACPWNYERCHMHINGLIRLDYAPLWFVTGLLYEQLFLAKLPPQSPRFKKDQKCPCFAIFRKSTR